LAPEASAQLSATAELLGSGNAVVLKSHDKFMAQIGHQIIPPKRAANSNFCSFERNQGQQKWPMTCRLPKIYRNRDVIAISNMNRTDSE
jgi:hypothetical protein